MMSNTVGAQHTQGHPLFDHWLYPSGVLVEHFAHGGAFGFTSAQERTPFSTSGLGQRGLPPRPEVFAMNLAQPAMTTKAILTASLRL